MMESNLLPSNEFPSMRLQRAHCAEMVSPIKLNHMIFPIKLNHMSGNNGILDVYLMHDNVGTQS